MAHRKNPSLCGLEYSREYLASTSGGGLRRFGFEFHSFCIQLLGIIFLAEQFAVASAHGMCQAFIRVNKGFDMIGLISAVGTTAATKSLSYSALNDSSFYLTGHIGPGSLNMAAAMLEAAELGLARLLALAGMADVCRLFQLDCPNGLRYIGLKSNSECPVGNSVGASIIREHQNLWKDEIQTVPELGRRLGRDAKRELKVITLEIQRVNQEIRSSQNTVEKSVSLRAAKGDAFWLGWVPLLLTLVVVGSCFNCKEWAIGGLILLGTLGMTVAVVALRFCGFKYSAAVVADGAPEGDCLVVDDMDGSTLHIIKGKEESIQNLFQRKIDFQASIGKYALFLAGIILYVYVMGSVLVIPTVSGSGQFYYLVANVIGFVADLVKGSQNGRLGLAKKARKEFRIVLKDYIVFQNRTAAVAYVAKYTNDRIMLKSKKLLPCDGPVWQIWWDKLPLFVGVVDEATIQNVDAGLDGKQQTLLRNLLSDMRDGLNA